MPDTHQPHEVVMTRDEFAEEYARRSEVGAGLPGPPNPAAFVGQ
jgi:hypothetical protein